MHILTWIDTLDVELELIYRGNDKWVTYVTGCSFYKDGQQLETLHNAGTTPLEALRKLCDQISHSEAVFKVFSVTPDSEPAEFKLKVPGLNYPS